MRETIMVLLLFMAGCSAAMRQNPKCPDKALVEIEAEYIASVLVFCQKYGDEGEPPVEECPAYPKLRDQAAERRRKYVECK